MPLINKILTLVVTLNLAACSLYRPELAQGNTPELANLQELEVGMSKSEVNSILGSSALQRTIEDSREDYVYANLAGHKRDEKPDFSRITLIFKNDKLSGYYSTKSYPNLKIEHISQDAK